MITQRISVECGLTQAYVQLLANTASHRYKSYKIKKRTKGYRQIEHPARELKLVQRWLINNIFVHLPVHESVYSYRRGISISKHASLHVKNSFLMRIDFADFFPSIRAVDIRNLLDENALFFDESLSKRDIQIIAKLVCRNGNLTIGAPSSPILSNAILFQFDESVSRLCRKSGVLYSRYADDLYFSTNKADILNSVYEYVDVLIKEMKTPRIRINRDKTVFTSRKRLRRVTGLVLTSDKKVSLGRDKKRYIRSLVYKYMNDELSKPKTAYLRGYLAFAVSVEPTFINSLENKYGKELLDEIRG